FPGAPAGRRMGAEQLPRGEVTGSESIRRLVEELQEIVPGRRLASQGLAGEGSRQSLTPRIEIFDWALAVDPRQAAGRRVPVRSSSGRSMSAISASMRGARSGCRWALVR